MNRCANNPSRKQLTWLWAALMWVPALCHAGADADEAALAELMDVLSEETELVTKTRMNADFVPGLVTVLDAELLRAQGAQTVYDALSFVPGIEPSRDPGGTNTLAVRGIPFPFNLGSVHVMVNGHALASESAGLNNSLLFWPIQGIERIEFVRGPGSVIYGEFAFQGILNIITRSADEVSLTSDGRGGYTGALAENWQGAAWQADLNLSMTDLADPLLPSQVPGSETRQIGNALWSGYGLALQLNWLDRTTMRGGNQAGQMFDEQSYAASVDYQRALTDASDFKLNAQHLRNDLATQRNAFNGVQSSFGVEWRTRSLPKQEWLLGLNYLDGRIDNAVQVPTVPVNVPPPRPVPIAAKSRQISSFYAQDQISLHPDFTLTLGARFDDNSEVGQRITPRVSAVWQMAPGHLLKTQYAEGFRSPAYFEQYTDPVRPQLDFEVNRTLELSYIRQGAASAFRATVFRTQIDDMIFRNFQLRRFGNDGEANSHGVELEWNWRINAAWRLDSNLARIEAEHNRNPTLTLRDLSAAAQWLGQVAVLWQPSPDWDIGLRLQHVGDRTTLPADTRDYNKLSLSLGQRNLWRAGSFWRLSLDNAGQEDIVYVQLSPTANVPVPLRDRRLYAEVGWRW